MCMHKYLYIYRFPLEQKQRSELAAEEKIVFVSWKFDPLPFGELACFFEVLSRTFSQIKRNLVE